MINANCFLAKIKNADFYKLPSQEISPYLVEHLIDPVLHGKTVFYGDLDFDRFTLDEIEQVADLVEKADIRENTLCEKINRAIHEAEASEAQVDYL